MRGRTYFRTFRWRKPDPPFLRRMALAVCFLLGAVLGHVFCRRVADEAALAAYMEIFCEAYSRGEFPFSAGRCILLYLTPAALVFLFGFSAAGSALIPAVGAGIGFVSMYTLGCFVCAFGRAGVWLGGGILLVRLLFTLPCFFLQAESAWPLSISLALLAGGRGKRGAPVQFTGRYFLQLLLCVCILIAGMFCERIFAPVLLRAAAQRVLG